MKRVLSVIACVLCIEVAALGQEGAAAPDAPGPVYVIANAPLRPGLALRAASGRGPVVTEVTPEVVKFRYEGDTPNMAEYAEDRVTGLYRMHWLTLSAAQEISKAAPGETMRFTVPGKGSGATWRLSGISLLPCRSNDQSALVPCWVLHSHWASLCVLADPANPLVVEQIGPTGQALPAVYLPEYQQPPYRWTSARIVEISGPGIDLVPLNEWRAE